MHFEKNIVVTLVMSAIRRDQVSDWKFYLTRTHITEFFVQLEGVLR